MRPIEGSREAPDTGSFTEAMPDRMADRMTGILVATAGE